EFQHARLAVGDYVGSLGHHGALDAAAGDRAEEIAVTVDDEMRADGPRRRAPGLDHGRDGDAAAVARPALGGAQDIGFGADHGPDPRWRGNGFDLMRQCPACVEQAEHGRYVSPSYVLALLA